MKHTLLSERQMEILRYRKQGLTQQQIADITLHFQSKCLHY